jgi:hypothetical protein
MYSDVSQRQSSNDLKMKTAAMLLFDDSYKSLNFLSKDSDSIRIQGGKRIVVRE